jgi:hypothetical protein
MCRTKKKDQNDQSKQGSSRRDDKSDESSSPGVSLMVKRLIDEPPGSDQAESRPLVNSVNSHITKKILDSDATDHIFCNRSSFITYTPKISICETDTRDKFTSEGYESVAMTLINGDNQTRDVTLTKMLYSSQLQYNLISTTKLARKEIETFLRLPHQLSQLILGNDVIAVIEMINDQYVLRKDSSTNPRALVKTEEPTIET